MKKFLFFSTVILIAVQAFAFGGGGSGHTSTYYKRHTPGVDAYGVHFHQNQTTPPDIHFINNDSSDQNCYYDSYGVKHCNEGYVMDEANYCTPNLCPGFYATDCTLSCDPLTGEKQLAEEDTPCGNGAAKCDTEGKCQCPWMDDWENLGAYAEPYLGKDGHTCCLDGYKWNPEISNYDENYVDVDIDICGCPVDYGSGELPHYGTDGTTCCLGQLAWSKNKRIPTLEDYYYTNPICGCPEGYATDERSQECIPEGYVSYCRQTDENGDCTSWDACLKKENTIFIDADGKPSARGVCKGYMTYVSGNYGGTEPYGTTCSDSGFSCNGEFKCQASNAWGQCLRWDQTHYDNQGVWQYDRYGCCTQLDDDGFCTNATTYQSYYDDTDAGCIDISDLCPSGQELFVGSCVEKCSDSYMVRPYPSNECRCKPGYSACNGWCQENCPSGFQLNMETCQCDFLPCNSGYFRVYWNASERPGECISCNDYNAHYSAYNQSSEGLTTADSCSACSNRESEIYGACALKTCPNGYFHDTSGNCVRCGTLNTVQSNECSLCSGLVQQSVQRTADGQSCRLTTCPSGYLHDAGGNCISCDTENLLFGISQTECETCTNRSVDDYGRCKLLTCPSGQIIKNHTCACPSGQFMGTDKTCYSCLGVNSPSATKEQCNLCPRFRTYIQSGSVCAYASLAAIDTYTAFSELNGQGHSCHYNATLNTDYIPHGDFVATKSECDHCSGDEARIFEQITGADSATQRPAIGACSYHCGVGEEAPTADGRNVVFFNHNGSSANQDYCPNCWDPNSYTTIKSQCDLCDNRTWTRTSWATGLSVDANGNFSATPALGTCANKCGANTFVALNGNCIPCDDPGSYRAIVSSCSLCGATRDLENDNGGVWGRQYIVGDCVLAQ